MSTKRKILNAVLFFVVYLAVFGTGALIFRSMMKSETFGPRPEHKMTTESKESKSSPPAPELPPEPVIEQDPPSIEEEVFVPSPPVSSPRRFRRWRRWR